MTPDSRETVIIAGMELEIAATNAACKIYADEFRGHTQKPLSGTLAADLIALNQQVAERGMFELPDGLTMAVWAMARAAGSTKLTWKAFTKRVDDAAYSYFEVEELWRSMLALTDRTFFRTQQRSSDADTPDTAKEKEE